MIRPRAALLVRSEIAAALGVNAAEIGDETNFQELGLDSMLAVRVQHSLERRLGVRLDATLLFTYPNVRELANWLAQAHGSLVGPDVNSACPEPGDERSGVADYSFGIGKDLGWAPNAPPEQPDNSRDIAIIGLAVRFPGASTVERFWSNLARGVDSIREVPADRWDWRRI